MKDGEVRVMFVCLGNICRSPLAEAIFRKHVEEAGYGGRIEIASCGTGDWHVGDDADERSRRIAHERGVAMRHRAQTLDVREHGSRYTYFVAMDRKNVRTLVDRGIPADKIYLMQAFAEGGRVIMAECDHASAEVPDPYYEQYEAFGHVFDMLEDSCRGLLAFIKEKHL